MTNPKQKEKKIKKYEIWVVGKITMFALIHAINVLGGVKVVKIKSLKEAK